jgi:hypothetical protein
MAGEFFPRNRAVQVFKDLQQVYPSLPPDAIAHKASNMIGHDAGTILRVVNEELAETEGGSAD